jgi:excisionase family DNA binding protein
MPWRQTTPEEDAMSRQAATKLAGRTDHQGASSDSERVGPRRSAEEQEEKMSRTGELVVILQDQVEQLTVAIRSLERHLPAPLVSVQDAAERLGVSVNTVRRRVKSGHIPSTRIGKAVRIDLTKVRPLDQVEVSELAERALRRASRAK